ncbi:MAG: hypothetical protein BMS9Abin05_1090 [Rhodothermia bacterium]|nr:MAG: hypothetical protein BMS9Abin05_1090 [Rhodothermia bacterium]
MRIACVQTYPIYHDFLSTEKWLSLDNRDKWIPRVLADMGHDVELWAVDRSASVHYSDGYVIRLFKSSCSSSKTKFHFSETVIDHAKTFDPTLCVLKGVDGGVGIHLIKRYLKSRSVPYALIIGGKFYTKHLPDAAAVLYESDFQRRRLIRPLYPWRRSVNPDRLIQLPKTIDTGRFRPMPEITKSWDILTVGRLIPKFKSYKALGMFPREVSIAVAGGGPQLSTLKKRYPWITWLGQVEHDDIPIYMNRARLFLFSSFREYFPRVIAEASACGIPSVAFRNAIGSDVLPRTRGLRVNHRDMVRKVQALLGNPSQMAQLSKNNRAYAESVLCQSALTEPVRTMLRTVVPDGV